ncbi:MAG: DUF58 domain-containing protein [Bacteroidales bacterium]|jgi:uncharacterized protein (DUF58 family)|nr:DUF58 domain-containing protein [Bacteroidales bacterium]
MEAAELLKKVRKIEIKTRALSQQVFAGQYHSAFKGRGMAFSEVRQYHYGDDVRFIDWNVTARFNQPYVKVFEEERELTVVLLIDVSGSNLFGTRQRFKSELVTELAAVLAFSAIHNNDKVGVIFFSDKVEKFIPPKKGKSHILRIIRELLNYEPAQSPTDIGEALRYLTNAIKKKCTAFMISDFVDSNFEQALKIAANKHDVVALQVIDRGESQLPDLGLVQLKDPETGRIFLADTSDKAVRQAHARWWFEQRSRNEEIFNKAGVDVAQLYTDKDYVTPLLELFRRRG